MSLKTVIVGCGAISAKHIDGIRQNDGAFRVVGVHDIDETRVRDAAAKIGGGCRGFSDMGRMAESCRPDIAVIATPSRLHADQAVFWMQNGAHLVLEKPVALDTADIDRVAEVQQNTGRRIAVGYVSRYSPHTELLARVLEAGRFGRIFHVGLTIYWNRNDDYYHSASWRGTWENDGGSLMNQATHGIDLLQWILGGRPVSVTGTLARFLRPIEADDFASATIEFDTGAVATLQATVATYPNNLGTRLTILGENGTVEISGNGPDAITVWRFPEDEGWREIDNAVSEGRIPDDGSLTAHAGLYQDLARAIAEEREPRTAFSSGRISAEIILGILKSHQERSSVSFPVDFSTDRMVGTTLQSIYSEALCSLSI